MLSFGDFDAVLSVIEEADSDGLDEIARLVGIRSNILIHQANIHAAHNEINKMRSSQDREKEGN
jgi:hypothetical protein